MNNKFTKAMEWLDSHSHWHHEAFKVAVQAQIEGGWLPIETIPYRKIVLVCEDKPEWGEPEWHVCMQYDTYEDGFPMTGHGRDLTHWRPLNRPQPPKEGE